MRFLNDLQHWVASEPRLAARVLRMMVEIARNPQEGIGKPERLKHVNARDCSRRINQEHRMVYRFDDEHIEFISAQFHYG